MSGWRRRPWGLAGGQEGSTNSVEYLRGDATRLRHGRVRRIELEPGDSVRIVTGAGGGYGDPASREPERVAADVRNGYVTVELARERYGVVVDESSLELDEDVTGRLRARR